MQAKTFDDVSDNTVLLNIILKQTTLRDARGLKNVSKKYEALLPSHAPLHKYIIDWHTEDLPALVPIKQHWYTIDEFVFSTNYSVWCNIFSDNNLPAALLFCKAKSNRKEENWIGVNSLACITSIEMMQIVMKHGLVETRCSCQESFRDSTNPGFTLEQHGIRIYVAAVMKNTDGVILPILNELGITNHQLAVQLLLAHSPHQSSNLALAMRLLYFLLEETESEDPTDDPVYSLIDSVPVLIEYIKACGSSFDVADLDRLAIFPFHILAKGYPAEYEEDVLEIFKQHFLYGTTEDERNSTDESGDTVLRMLYTTRPLNRNLLVVLNKFGHDDELYYE